MYRKLFLGLLIIFVVSIVTVRGEEYPNYHGGGQDNSYDYYGGDDDRRSFMRGEVPNYHGGGQDNGYDYYGDPDEDRRSFMRGEVPNYHGGGQDNGYDYYGDPDEDRRRMPSICAVNGNPCSTNKNCCSKNCRRNMFGFGSSKKCHPLNVTPL